MSNFRQFRRFSYSVIVSLIAVLVFQQPAFALTLPSVSVSYPKSGVVQGEFGVIAFNGNDSDYYAENVDVTFCTSAMTCNASVNLEIGYSEASARQEYVNSRIAIVAQSEEMFLVNAKESGTYTFLFTFHYKNYDADNCNSFSNACLTKNVSLTATFDKSRQVSVDAKFLPDYLYSDGIRMTGNFGLACAAKVTKKTFTCKVTPTNFVYLPNTNYTNNFSLKLKGNLAVTFHVVFGNYYTHMYVYKKTVTLGKTSSTYTFSNPKWYLHEYRPYVQVMPRAMQDYPPSPSAWFQKDVFWKAGRWY